MEPTADPVLTAWAADCAEHALAQFPDFADTAAQEAIGAARAWARDGVGVDACRDAAFAAHLSARELAEAGYHAVATVVRAASNAAASADDAALAEASADYAVEAVSANSAPCEHQHNLEAERRWQWERLAPAQRPRVFDTEPPQPGPAACAI
jgi:hypothetical protein